MSTQETDPDLHVSVQEPWQRHGSAVACCRFGGTECSSVCMGTLKEVSIIFITFTIVWTQVNNMGASLVAQRLKHLPAMQETWVQSLGQEDPLEKEMATHSSILTWRIPWTEEPDRLQSTGLQRVGHN